MFWYGFVATQLNFSHPHHRFPKRVHPTEIDTDGAEMMMVREPRFTSLQTFSHAASGVTVEPKLKRKAREELGSFTNSIGHWN